MSQSARMSRPAVFITHPAFLAPGFGAHHPQSTGRQAAVVHLCEALGWLPPTAIQTPALPDRATLAAIHTADYLSALERAAIAGLATPDDRRRFNLGTMECPVFPGLWERARASVGGAILAAEIALTGALAFHPAGGTHHGRPDRASGFCYLNDPAFAIRTLLAAGIDRVAYVDLDAHHGDGVEALFENEPRVALFSVHEADRWPGTGHDGERDGGRITNLVMPRRCGDEIYLQRCVPRLDAWCARFARQAVVVTLGADPLAGDPLSSMNLSNAVMLDTLERVVAASQKSVILGGGGYNPWTTARLWTAAWGRLNGWRAPDPLPVAAQQILAALDSDLIDTEDRLAAWLTTLDDRRIDPAAT